jgi:hypothetical protein
VLSIIFRKTVVSLYVQLLNLYCMVRPVVYVTRESIIGRISAIRWDLNNIKNESVKAMQIAKLQRLEDQLKDYGGETHVLR